MFLSVKATSSVAIYEAGFLDLIVFHSQLSFRPQVLDLKYSGNYLIICSNLSSLVANDPHEHIKLSTYRSINRYCTSTRSP